MGFQHLPSEQKGEQRNVIRQTRGVSWCSDLTRLKRTELESKENGRGWLLNKMPGYVLFCSTWTILKRRTENGQGSKKNITAPLLPVNPFKSHFPHPGKMPSCFAGTGAILHRTQDIDPRAGADPRFWSGWGAAEF